MDLHAEARRDVLQCSKKMWEAGMVVASAGNVSRRAGAKQIAITPSGIPYESMQEEQIVVVDLETGKPLDPAQTPSYELPMHLIVYRSVPHAQAIVHTHAPFITTLSVLRRPLPPIIDEMMLYFGGTVEVADYAFTGTDEVGTNVVRALGDRNGAILANHGNICIGHDLAQALHIALTMEAAARVYVQALAIGKPVELPRTAIVAGRHMFEERNKR